MRLRQILVLSLALLSLAVALVTGRDLFYSLFYLWVALIAIAAGWAWLSLRGVRVGRQTRGLASVPVEIAATPEEQRCQHSKGHRRAHQRRPCWCRGAPLISFRGWAAPS